MSRVSIRATRRSDARIVTRMAAEFYAHMNALSPGEGELAFTEAAYLRDGFGKDPAFQGLLAECEGEPVGYLLYSFVYDVDLAARVLHVSDLFVRETARRRGIGRVLMSAAADAVWHAGGRVVIWEVLSINRTAVDFYQSLGAQFLPKSAYMFWQPGRQPG